MVTRNTQALSLLLLCSGAVSADPANVAKEAQKAEQKIVGEIKKAEQKVAIVSDIDKKASSPVVSTFDQITGMSQSELGKEEQKVMEKRQTELAAQLEEQRKGLDERLKQFNAKKDTMSKEAREKEEQELMAASNALQTEVRKAQETIRGEMTKATEKLAKLAEEAAVEIAKAENVDVLLEKNTGRVVYTKNGTDLTDKIQRKMNEKTALAKNKAPKPTQKTA
jgi:Skp family chaperone for outer membrane proteins